MATNFALEPGCYVDGNCMNSDEFNREIVFIAMTQGMELTNEDVCYLSGEYEDEDSSQIISDLADEAVEYLNAIDEGDMALPSGWCWVVDESCLLLIEGEDEDWERDMGTNGVVPE